MFDMSSNYAQHDIRIKKTHRALFDALTILLSKKNFGKITVNDICEKSQISRATFYGYFNDKYDLLKWWLTIWKPEINAIRYDYAEFEETINKFVDNNRNIIINLLESANDEVIELITDCISSLLSEFIGDKDRKESNQFSAVLYCFCAGGIISLILWQIRNKFPINLKMANEHFYEILGAIRQLENDNSNDNK